MTIAWRERYGYGWERRNRTDKQKAIADNPQAHARDFFLGKRGVDGLAELKQLRTRVQDVETQCALLTHHGPKILVHALGRLLLRDELDELLRDGELWHEEYGPQGTRRLHNVRSGGQNRHGSTSAHVPRDRCCALCNERSRKRLVMMTIRKVGGRRTRPSPARSSSCRTA
ncbi:hypothetical protein EXIGLDRAFT_258322 [Exidia glandulosa HHB12029]|uniref:Uncharacterized protein n=1 Tax=Exidia glandulosa HHB12029 TaxID=1314781 RepID=A0A165MD67_EXIGL|nr:hypothetical protein EXIGLDRAFT_258322 [Exidia glandulosa HHB12029]